MPAPLPRYEQIAQLTGVRMAPFGEMFRDQVVAMKRSVLTYVKAAKSMATQLESNGTGIPVQITTSVGVMAFATEPKYSLGQTDAGFPVLPRPMNTQGWTKKDWEALQMEYMCSHYSQWPSKLPASNNIDLVG